MKVFVSLLMLGLALLSLPGTSFAEGKLCSTLLNFEKQRLASDERVNLCEAYQGKVILVVNTASKCGYTYQYDGLEKLYRQYGKQGLVVLGFPSNDFAGQEPGSEEQIQNFCRLTYGVKFPMFEKGSVAKGTDDPFYRALAKAAGEFPGWNFHKYLIDRDGNLVASYPSREKPLGKRIVSDIERLL